MNTSPAQPEQPTVVQQRAPLRKPSAEVVIVTHDDPEAARSAAEAALGSCARPSSVSVIDTAGDRPAIVPLDGVRIIRTSENVGPAGGWAEGLEAFLAGDADLAWLLDDDCVPRPDALGAALEQLGSADVVQSTMVERGTGRVVSTQGWCGVLVPRYVVEDVGLPDRDLVWWTEDTEYIQWRIPRAGYRVVRSTDSVVEVALRPDRAPKPAWKYYYEARNQVAYRIRTQRPSSPADRGLRHLTRRVRWWRATRSVSKLAARSVVVERKDRLRKLGAVVHGTWHGLSGRTGLTVPLGEPDRARTAERTGT